MEFHSDDSILQILEVRRILEPAATAMAARVCTVEQVAQLREMAAQDTVGTQSQDLVIHDLAFHSAIAATSGNPVLAGMLDSIAMPTSRARVWRGLTQQDVVGCTIEQHLGIVEAIAAGDAVLAEARAIVHIAGVQEWITLARTLDRLTQRCAAQGPHHPSRNRRAGVSSVDGGR